MVVPARPAGIPGMGHRCEQDQRLDLIGIIERHAQGHCAAKGMAHHHGRFAVAHRLQKAGHLARLHGQLLALGWALGIAEPGPVGEQQIEPVFQIGRKAPVELMGIGAGPVHEEDRSRAGLSHAQDMHVRAVHLHHLAIGRKAGFHARGIDRAVHASAEREAQKAHQNSAHNRSQRAVPSTACCNRDTPCRADSMRG